MALCSTQQPAHHSSWCLSSSDEEEEKKETAKVMDVVPYDPAIAKTAGAPSPTNAWIDFSAQQKKSVAWLRSNPVGRLFVSRIAMGLSVSFLYMVGKISSQPGRSRHGQTFWQTHNLMIVACWWQLQVS